MDTMRFTAEEKKETFRLLAAILWLGNITFGEENERSFIADEDTLAMFAYLIQSDTETCRNALISRTISTGTGGRSARVSTYGVPQNAFNACIARDALAKAIYSRLFDYTIAKGSFGLLTASFNIR
jgi:myosin-1